MREEFGKEDKDILEEGLRGFKPITMYNISGNVYSIDRDDWNSNKEYTYRHNYGHEPFFIMLYNDGFCNIKAIERTKMIITFKIDIPCNIQLLIT